MKFGEMSQVGSVEKSQAETENKTEKENKIEYKKEIANAWCEMVLGAQEVPQNVEEMSDIEFKKWLNDSLMLEIDKLSTEWGLEASEELIAKIKEAENEQQKAQAQETYLQACWEQLHELMDRLREDEERSCRWDSWPLVMRENKGFNCVGASLLGQRLLDRAGIENCYGNPSGHVVNMANLANGDWWYVDLLNDKRNVRKIEPMEREFSGTKAFEVRYESMVYRYILLYEKKEAPLFVIANLGALSHEAMSPEIPDDNPGKMKTQEFRGRFAELLDKEEFHNLTDKLYPDRVAVHSNEEIGMERKRVDNKHHLFDDVLPTIKKRYMQKHSEESWQNIIKESAKNKLLVRKFFYENDGTLLDSLSSGLKEIMVAYHEELQPLQEWDIETYWDIVEKMTRTQG